MARQGDTDDVQAIEPAMAPDSQPVPRPAPVPVRALQEPPKPAGKPFAQPFNPFSPREKEKIARMYRHPADRREAVLRAVCGVWKVRPEGILSAVRTRVLYRPRFAAYLILVEEGLTLHTIAKMLGNKDHTSVMNGANKARYYIETDKDWRDKFNVCRALLGLGEPRLPDAGL